MERTLVFSVNDDRALLPIISLKVANNAAFSFCASSQVRHKPAAESPVEVRAKSPLRNLSAR